MLFGTIFLTLNLSLAAIGLAVIFGLMRVINLGHGALLAIGAYVMWATVRSGVPFPAAVAMAALVAGIIGGLFEFVIIRHFYDQLFDTILITWGFALVVTEVIKIIFGSSNKNVPNPVPGALGLGPINIPGYQLVLSGTTIALIVAIALIFYRTNLGLRVRAMIQDREAASLLGVDVRWMYRLVFVAGSALAGFAGAMLSPILSVDPNFGTVYLVRSFFVVIVGGAGQLLAGTLAGSLVIGGSETLFSAFSNEVFAETVVFALAIVILRFFPRGLLSGRGR